MVKAVLQFLVVLVLVSPMFLVVLRDRAALPGFLCLAIPGLTVMFGFLVWRQVRDNPDQFP